MTFSLSLSNRYTSYLLVFFISIGYVSCNSFYKLCWSNRSLNLICHNVKIHVPSNLVTSNSTSSLISIWYHLLGNLRSVGSIDRLKVLDPRELDSTYPPKISRHQVYGSYLINQMYPLFLVYVILNRSHLNSTISPKSVSHLYH